MVADALKRLLDIVAAAIGIVVLSPFLVLVALAVKITSPGPVFYRGERTGRFGKTFRIYKFRTMILNAEQVGGSTTAEADPRITSIGRKLRKYKIDELPQLFNVLRGEMSMVGPRPEVPEYTQLYQGDFQRILTLRPGITDPASMQFHDLQACVGSENADEVFREKILPVKNQLRLKYVDEQTIRGDVVILLKTLAIVLSKPCVIIRKLL